MTNVTHVRIPLHQILIKANVPTGMDPCVALGFVKRLRTTTEDWDPVSVRPEGEYYRLMDGRHRYFASVIAGRVDILAELDIADLDRVAEA
jgi:hypothetical protein